jgi:hypothetical protein
MDLNMTRSCDQCEPRVLKRAAAELSDAQHRSQRRKEDRRGNDDVVGPVQMP